MTLDEVLEICSTSDPDAWNTITCWGSGSGPSYLDQFEPTIFRGEYRLGHREHAMRATYKPNAAIGIAWGLDPDESFPDDTDRRAFTEPWTESFADPQASRLFVDFFYYGAIVNREYAVSVDGGRCYLPVPKLEFAEGSASRSEVTGYSITRWQHDFFAVLDALERASEFDRYVKQAGFEVRD